MKGSGTKKTKNMDRPRACISLDYTQTVCATGIAHTSSVYTYYVVYLINNSAVQELLILA